MNDERDDKIRINIIHTVAVLKVLTKLNKNKLGINILNK